MTAPALPAEVLTRFPDFDPEDPATWPEPGRCTDGAPFGPYAYGNAVRWEAFLAQLDREARTGKRDAGSPRCRNNARHDHLCGTHNNVRTDRVRQEERTRRSRENHLIGTELARRLIAHGIACENRGDAILIHREDAEELLHLFDARTLTDPTPGD